MKKLIFVFVFACSVGFTAHSMEPEKVENTCNAVPVKLEKVENVWDMFPVDIKAKIFAHLSLEKQEKIYSLCPRVLSPNDLTNKDNPVCSPRNRLDIEIKKWLLSRMIHVAKKKNRINFKKLMRHVTANGHDDILDAMKYFFTKGTKQYVQFCEYSVMKDDITLELSLLDIMSGFQDCSKCVKTLLKSALSADKVKPVVKLPPDEGRELYYSTDLHRLILSGQNTTLIKIFLLQKPELLNAKSDTIGSTPLCLAIRKNNLELCKFLLSFESIDITVINEKKNTPWVWALWGKNKAIVESLLNYIVDHHMEEKCLQCPDSHWCPEKKPCCHVTQVLERWAKRDMAKNL